MNRMKRTLAILLASLMLLPALAACGEADEPADTKPSQTTSADEVDTSIPADELPADLNYKGEKITFISVNAMDYDELTGDAVEDAIYERNKAVEERLGVEIQVIHEETPIDKVVTAVSSGNTDYPDHDLLYDT